MTHTHPLVERFGHQRRWCNWYYGKPDKNGKRAKIPTAHRKAVDATHPHDRLLTFAEAQRANAKHIGIALGECEGEWLSGFDRDECIESGALSPDMVAFVEQAQTTDDISPSGKGVHLFVITREQIQTRIDKAAGYEFYGAGRFFTFTGKPLAQISDPREMSKASASALVDAFFGSASATPKTPAPVQHPPTPAADDELADALSFVGDWRADDRREWVRVGMAIKAARPGDDGRELWRAFSQRSAKYDADTFERDWQSLKPRSIGIGTIYHMAREDGGWRPPSSSRNKTRAQVVDAMHALRRIALPECLPVRDERTDIGTLSGEPIVEHRKAINVSRGSVFALADALLAFAWHAGHTKGATLSVRRMADLASIPREQAWRAFVAMRRLGWIRQPRGYIRHANKERQETPDFEHAPAFDLVVDAIKRAGRMKGTEDDILSQDCFVSASHTTILPNMSSSVPLPYGRMRMIAARGLWTLLGPTARRICECLDAGERTHEQLIALTHYTGRAVSKALARLAEMLLIESGRDGWALVFDFDLRANAICDAPHGKRERVPAKSASRRRGRHAQESSAFLAVMDAWRVERALADEPGADAGIDAMGGERVDAALVAMEQGRFKATNRARDWRAGIELSTLKREAREGWARIHAERVRQ